MTSNTKALKATIRRRILAARIIGDDLHIEVRNWKQRQGDTLWHAAAWAAIQINSMPDAVRAAQARGGTGARTPCRIARHRRGRCATAR